MTRVTFNNRTTPFYNALKAKVDSYFESNNLEKTGNSYLYFKAILFLLSAAGLYTWLVFFNPGWAFSLVLCSFLGISLAGIGFNAMHDGAHGSFSKKKWVNEFMAFTLNIMGGNSFLWKAKHNVVHHSFTNIHGMDDDIDIEPWIRVHPEQEKYKFHKFQHVYSFALYGLTYMTWVYMMDFQKYFSGMVASTKFAKMGLLDHIMFWFSKLMYTTFFLILPVFFVGFVSTIVGYFVTAFVCGVVIAVVFQLAHVVEATDFPQPDEKGRMQQEWAVHQISTTANFATQNKIVSFFMGGLNFQVEHHLFPKISHVHYPRINQLIKETCAEFNLTYREYRTVGQAIAAHVRYLKLMGA